MLVCRKYLTIWQSYNSNLFILILLQIIFVCCKRLLQLCGLDYSKLRLTNHRLRGKPGDDVDTTDGSDELDSCMNDRNEGSNESTCDISASMEDLKGEVDTENVSSNDECDGLSEKLTDSQTSACMSFENDTEIEKSSRRKSDSALCLGGKQRDSVGNKISLGNKPMVENTLESHEGNALPNKDNLNNEISKLNQLHNASDSYANQEGCGMMTSENAGKEHVTVDDVARAFSIGPNEVMDKVQSIQVCCTFFISLIVFVFCVKYFVCFLIRDFLMSPTKDGIWWRRKRILVY